MKCLSVTIVALLLPGIFAAACGVQTSPTPAPESYPPTASAKTRVGVTVGLPPFEIAGPDQNDLAGFDIELMKSIAIQTGLNVEFVNVGYDQLINSVGQCQLDMAISAIAINDGLKKQVDLSDAYFSAGQALVVKQGNITVTSLEKLTGMTVGAMAATPGETAVRAIAGAQAKFYPTYYQAFQDLITGNIDAVIADTFHAALYVGDKPNNLKVVGSPFGSVNFGMAVCKNEPELLKKLNAGIAATSANGTLKKLAQKWIPNNGGQ